MLLTFLPSLSLKFTGHSKDVSHLQTPCLVLYQNKQKENTYLFVNHINLSHV